MKNPIIEKSTEFAVFAVRIGRQISGKYREFDITRQWIRCATSIGANVTEAQYGQSQADFVSKMNIAQKEAGESLYWIEVLYKSKLLPANEYQTLCEKNKEIIRILTSIIKTTKQKEN